MISCKWESLHLPAGVKKRGRPKNNNGYFNTFHQRKKARHASSVLNAMDSSIIISYAVPVEVTIISNIDVVTNH